jgi:hypothetical protein
MEKIGTWAFLIGVLIAIVAGLVPALAQPPLAGQVAWVLVILGLVVGFLNIRAKECQEFLVATTAILVVAGMGGLPPLGRTLGTILVNIIAFVAPAAFLVACKEVWHLAED